MTFLVARGLGFPIVNRNPSNSSFVEIMFLYLVVTLITPLICNIRLKSGFMLIKLRIFYFVNEYR